MKPIDINLSRNISVERISQSHRNSGYLMWGWGGRKNEVRLDVDQSIQSVS